MYLNTIQIHVNVIKKTFWVFLLVPSVSAGRSAARQPDGDVGWSLRCLQICLASCRSNSRSEITWTSPRSFASPSATYACTHCSKVPMAITHISHTLRACIYAQRHTSNILHGQKIYLCRWHSFISVYIYIYNAVYFCNIWIKGYMYS